MAKSRNVFLQKTFRRLRFYVLINAFIVAIAMSTRYVLNHLYLNAVFRAFTAICWFLWISGFKQPIHTSNKGKQVDFIGRCKLIARILLVTAPVEAMSVWLLQKSYPFAPGSTSLLEELVFFIPKSLVFEIIFDFFHYSIHRSCHLVPFLYKYVHKRHHIHLHPSPLTTYEQDFIDMIFTNMIPFLIAMYCIPNVTSLQVHLILAYKTYVEVAGHSGLDLKGFSFPQCPLVHTYFGIGLRVHDHDLHHTHPTVNFSKRFSLWDRVFGTFVDSAASATS